MNQVSDKYPSRAVYALSADPITLGHVDIVQRAARCFSYVIVGIGQNPLKTYLFSLEERRQLAETALSHLGNVEVVAFEGLLVDFAYDQCATVIVRGVRSGADLDYEQTLHNVGASQELGIDTHLLFADPKLSHISSSIVKAMQLEHGFIQGYVPLSVKAALEAKLSKQLVIGVTGDIASGKSTLTEALVEEGVKRGLQVHNIDLDKLGHNVLEGQGIAQPLYDKLRRTLVGQFGEDVIIDGQISRLFLAKRVFSNSKERAKLNQLMVSPIAILLRRQLQGKEGVILLNGALLADFGLLALSNNRCVLLHVDVDEQKCRLTGRGLNAIEVDERLGSQLRGRDKARLIKDSIEKSGFGRVWSYGKEVLSPSLVLDDILSECKEFSWS